MKAEELDKIFDEGEDITPYLDLSTAQRPERDNVPYRIKEIINSYIEALKKNNIPVQQAILYGSYANGRYNKYSDIDIAVVSKSFEGIRIFDRNKIMKITLEVSKDIEPMPFTPENFTIDDPFVKEILETGVVIK